MAEEPTYLDRLRHVNNLLHSMESDFLAVLAEHKSGQSKLVAPEQGPSSKPPNPRVAYPKRLIRRQRKTRSPKPPTTHRQANPGGWPSLWWGDWPVW